MFYYDTCSNGIIEHSLWLLPFKKKSILFVLTKQNLYLSIQNHFIFYLPIKCFFFYILGLMLIFYFNFLKINGHNLFKLETFI